ncbi:LAFA_0D00760g1_1 [Lachancea sp. 'fantastica']|nr:LAFA_0D00760g1_1 [Lachancea sp. 'fantastica']
MPHWSVQGSLKDQLRELSHLLLEERLRENRADSVEPDRGSSDFTDEIPSVVKGPVKRTLSQAIDFDTEDSHRDKRDLRYVDVSLQIVADPASEQRFSTSSSFEGFENDDFPIGSEATNVVNASIHSESHLQVEKNENYRKNEVHQTNADVHLTKTVGEIPVSEKLKRSSLRTTSSIDPVELELDSKQITNLLKLCLIPSSITSMRDSLKQLPRYFSQETTSLIREVALTKDFTARPRIVTSILQDRDLLPAESSNDGLFELCCQYLCMEDLIKVEMALYT